MNGYERSPRFLKAGGRGLWHSIVHRYELREDELVVLLQACRQTDELARLEAELRTAPTMVTGSAGQTRPNPLFAEIRQHRLAQSRLLQALGLADVELGGVSRSSAGHRLARLRWSGKHTRGET